MTPDEKALAKHAAKSAGTDEQGRIRSMLEQIRLLETALTNAAHVPFAYYLGGRGLTHGQAAHRATIAHREALKRHAWAAIQRARTVGE